MGGDVTGTLAPPRPEMATDLALEHTDAALHTRTSNESGPRGLSMSGCVRGTVHDADDADSHVTPRHASPPTSTTPRSLCDSPKLDPTSVRSVPLVMEAGDTWESDGASTPVKTPSTRPEH